MAARSKIPRPTVKRLSLYLRELEALPEHERPTISSAQLGRALGLTDAQVRKDLAYFGQFGHPGIGYRVSELIENLRKILGTDRPWKTALVGAGNIGRALLAYPRFGAKGFEIAAVFDIDPSLVGRSIAGHEVHAMRDLPKLVRRRGIKLGIVAVPKAAAQEAADALIASGVIGILNFAPVRLDVHDAASVVSVDFSVALEQLAFEATLALAGALDDNGD
jgi:redox-sensing transcriptional repressor